MLVQPCCIEFGLCEMNGRLSGDIFGFAWLGTWVSDMNNGVSLIHRSMKSDGITSWQELEPSYNNWQ